MLRKDLKSLASKKATVAISAVYVALQVSAKPVILDIRRSLGEFCPLFVICLATAVK